MTRRLTTEQARLLAAAVLGIDHAASVEDGRRAYLRQVARTVSIEESCPDTLASVQFAWAVWQALDGLDHAAEIVLDDDLVVVIPDHPHLSRAPGPWDVAASMLEHVRGQRVDVLA